jgi:hypothetical protein
MPNWNQTPEQMFANLAKIAEEFKAKPLIPVGIVFKASLKSQVEAQFKRRSPTVGIIGLPFNWGIPIFYDLDQQKPCIEFFDDKSLRLYLNRKENPEAWALHLAEIVGTGELNLKIEPNI